MKATLNTYRQSPRKVRLVADVLRGKRALHALTLLRLLEKRAAGPLGKLLASAIANAGAHSEAEKGKLVIKAITVDKGATLKRAMPRARGRSSPIRKRTSHITISLQEES